MNQRRGRTVRGISAAIRIPRAVFVDVVVLVGMALLAFPIFLVLVTLLSWGIGVDSSQQ